MLILKLKYVEILFEPNELYSVSDRLDYIEIDSVSVYQRTVYQIGSGIWARAPPLGVERRPDTR